MIAAAPPNIEDEPSLASGKPLNRELNSFWTRSFTHGRTHRVSAPTAFLTALILSLRPRTQVEGILFMCAFTLIMDAAFNLFFLPHTSISSLFDAICGVGFLLSICGYSANEDNKDAGEIGSTFHRSLMFKGSTAL